MGCQVLVLDTIMLVMLGFASRCLAFGCLVLLNRDKRGMPSFTQRAFAWIVNPLDDAVR
jgi:hypothetical protein